MRAARAQEKEDSMQRGIAARAERKAELHVLEVWSDSQTVTHTDSHTHTHTHHTEETVRQRERQAGRQTDRHTDRETDRERDRDRQMQHGRLGGA